MLTKWVAYENILWNRRITCTDVADSITKINKGLDKHLKARN